MEEVRSSLSPRTHSHWFWIMCMNEVSLCCKTISFATVNKLKSAKNRPTPDKTKSCTTVGLIRREIMPMLAVRVGIWLNKWEKKRIEKTRMRWNVIQTLDTYIYIYLNAIKVCIFRVGDKKIKKKKIIFLFLKFVLLFVLGLWCFIIAWIVYACKMSCQ